MLTHSKRTFKLKLTDAFCIYCVGVGVNGFADDLTEFNLIRKYSSIFCRKTYI